MVQCDNVRIWDCFLAFYIDKVWEIKQILVHSLDPDLTVICTGIENLCSVQFMSSAINMCVSQARSQKFATGGEWGCLRLTF